MLFDTRFSDYDTDGIISEGEISIMDMKNMSFKHFMKGVTNMSTAKFYDKFINDATPLTLVSVHVINPSAIASKLFGFFKTFMKQKHLDVFHFHKDLESLYDHVPKELLPVELGGTQEITLDEVQEGYIRKMEKFR